MGSPRVQLDVVPLYPNEVLPLGIGTVSTGAAGSGATADISFVDGVQKLNLTVPRGADGSPGVITDGSVTDAKIAPAAGIQGSKVAFTPAVTGAGSRTLNDEYGSASLRNVKAIWFASAIGSPISQSEINAALTAAPSIVDLPAGLTATTAKVLAKSGIRLDGGNKSRTTLASSHASDPVISMEGTSSANSYFGSITGATLTRSVPGTKPTAAANYTDGAKALSATYSIRFSADDVYLQGSPIGAYIRHTINFSLSNSFINVQSSASGDWVIGAYIDGQDIPGAGVISPNASSYFQRVIVEPDAGPGTSVGFYITGAFSDQFLIDCETAGLSYGGIVDGGIHGLDPTADPTVVDLDFRHFTADGFKQAGLVLRSGGRKAQVTINDGYFGASGSAYAGIDISSFGGIVITGGTQFICWPAQASYRAIQAVTAQNLIIAEDVKIQDAPMAVFVGATKGGRICPSIKARGDKGNPAGPAISVVTSTDLVIAPQILNDTTDDAGNTVAPRYAYGVSVDTASSDLTIDVSGIDAQSVGALVQIGTFVPKFDWTYPNNVTVRGTRGKPPRFKARTSTSQTVPAGTWTAISFAVTDFNDQAAFSTTSGSFTAPVAGVYRFRGTFTLSANGPTYVGNTIGLNGTPVVSDVTWKNSPVASYDSIPFQSDIVLAAGDVITMMAFMGGAAGSLTPQSVSFSGSLLPA